MVLQWDAQGALVIEATSGSTVALELLLPEGKTGTVTARYVGTNITTMPPSFVVAAEVNALSFTIDIEPGSLPTDAQLNAVLVEPGGEVTRLLVWFWEGMDMTPKAAIRKLRGV
jgi:hypothetical protein